MDTLIPLSSGGLKQRFAEMFDQQGLAQSVNIAGSTFFSSTANSFNRSLNAGDSVQGTWENIFNQPALQILGDADQPMRYVIEQSIDAAGTKIVSRVEFFRGKSKDICENIQLSGNYVRVTIRNMGVDTAALEVNSAFGPLAALPQALSPLGNLRTSAAEVRNFNNKLRDAMEAYPNANWVREVKATNDLIRLEGNTVGASYLAMSLDPFSAGTDSFIETDASFKMPMEIGLGLHVSQRTYGQEMSVELVNGDDETSPTAAQADLRISSIQQAASVLTITFTANHTLKAGQRISIYGVNNDSRLNYPALVIASTPANNQITATAGPQGTIGSLTVGPYSPTAAFVYVRPALGRSTNGTAMVLENATLTNASVYVKSEGGDTTPIGGAPAGSHSVTTNSFAPAYPVTTVGAYSARPTNQYFLSLMADRIQWSNSAIDTTGQSAAIASFNQIVPNPDLGYKLRFRVKNHKSLSRPVAKIVSVTKSGTTTATVVTDVPHNLTTGDFINAYGVRDTTNFANLGTATAVASVINSTSFTVVWGAAVTATSYGGLVAICHGQQVVQGVSGQCIQQYATGTNTLSFVMNTTVSGLLNGDLVNVYGLRSAVNGSDIGLDGCYRVRDISGSQMTVEPLDGTTFATTGWINAGGTLIRRTDLRISFVRLFDYERLRVEPLARPGGDTASAFPVVIQAGVLSAAQSTALTLGSTGGGAWYTRHGIVKLTDIASAAVTSTGNETAVANDFGAAFQIQIAVTAVSGTSPTMDLMVQETDDGGTNWIDVYQFPRITATGVYRTPLLPTNGTQYRIVRTIGGTSPSFTRTVTRTLWPGSIPKPTRRRFDFSLAVNTLSSATASLWSDGCSNAQLVLNMGAITTTAPAVQLQGSEDGAFWYPIGSALTGVASAVVQLTVTNISCAFIRAIVTTAGSGATMNSLSLKAWG